ncbi:TspO/MBR family protein [Bacillus alkalisoli]|uniref:TspO/MBR family protein n=1 Tax=Bacillus alkalisoli TaxID=2011008 RepID=UPI000C23FF3E|nr:TspO/MBR family protein [Bacillus alkalisoli]
MTFWLNLTAFMLVIFVNFLANALPLNGQTTGEISNRLEVLITPASFAFSIWGLIYFLLGVWVLRQAPKRRRNHPLYNETSLYFIISCILNSAWVICWHYELFMTTVVIMVGLLVTLIVLYKKLMERNAGFWDKVPFSIYLGWISVATIVNISYYLVFIGWDGWGISAPTWTVIMLVVATILAIVFRVEHADWVYPLVFVWAFFAIGVKNMEAYASVAYVAYALAAVIFIITILGRRKA